MLKGIFMVLLLVCGSRTFGQINHVFNPDFEEYHSCPLGLEDIRSVKFWTAIDSTGILGCEPEYCNVCSSSPFCSVPQSGLYFQYPRSGKGMAQVQLYIDGSVTVPAFPDYLQGRLYKKLISGKSYCVTFYVNLEEASKYAIKEISAYLDDGAIDTNSKCKIQPSKYSPQISNTLGVLSDTALWVKVQGVFIATGNEQFISIGNFTDGSQTKVATMPHNPLNAGMKIAIYLIDDVSVIESDLRADAGPDRHIGKGDSTYLGRQKEVGLECSWSVLGSSGVIGTGAGIWVNPATTTSYVVNQTLCGQVKKDTVRVEVWGVGMKSINGQAQAYSIIPNPSNGNIRLHQAVEDDRPLQIEVLEVTGRRIYSTTTSIRDGSFALSLADLTAGMYYMVLRDSNGNAFTLKLIRE